MQLNLIDGAFTPQEAEELLRKLIKVKTDFHLHKIDTTDHSEENIKHSERRIKALEDDLREVIAAIRTNGDAGFISMHASVSVEQSVFSEAF